MLDVGKDWQQGPGPERLRYPGDEPVGNTAGIPGQFQAVETFTDCSDEEEPEALGEDDG
ncbi:hypothetical protein Plec18167_001651 [Paecilomyces lecythidis]|uniref:Uncharacterized protein n=1 Tax=Paecilomyces lecythidis TaxID=3004212 RepID=A0ABR3Y9L6_9EURO